MYVYIYIYIHTYEDMHEFENMHEKMSTVKEPGFKLGRRPVLCLRPDGRSLRKESLLVSSRGCRASVFWGVLGGLGGSLLCP